MADTIFDKSDDPQAEHENAEPTDQTGNAEEKGKQESEAPAYDFIGEGKKYKSVEDALQSLPHKEDFIEQLKRENEEMRTKLERANTVEDIMNQIKSEDQQGKEQEEVKQPQENAQQEQKPEISQEDIDRLIDQRISERERQQSAQQNIGQVVDKMTELYGDRAEEMYNERAQELGVPVEWLNQTAAQSPNAVFKLFGIDNKEKATPSKMTSSYNSNALNQPKQQEGPKPVMHGATRQEILSSWRAAKPQ